MLLPPSVIEACATYDRIGLMYSKTRCADERIVSRLRNTLQVDELHDGQSIIDVGAGTCNYSIPLAAMGANVVALDASRVMLEQASRRMREANAAGRIRLVKARAERMPFEAQTFSRLLCVFALHHFEDLKACVEEMMRVTVPQGVVAILTADPRQKQPIWIDRYFGFLVEYASTVYLPLAEVTALFEPYAAGEIKVEKMLLPRDIRDHFFLAGWACPERYLDEAVRAGISHFAKVVQSEAGRQKVEAAVERLRLHLNDGTWAEQYGNTLRNMSAYDGGYRIITFTRNGRF